MHDVQDPGNHLKLERTITLKKSNPMSTQSEGLFKTTAQFIVLYNRAVLANRTIRPDLNDESIRMNRWSRFACLLRQARRQSHLPVRNDHEDDQQHQQNINQRDYVHIRE